MKKNKKPPKLVLSVKKRKKPLFLKLLEAIESGDFAFIKKHQGVF